MKKLHVHLVVVTLVTMLVIGCSQQNNPTEPSVLSGKNISSLAKGRMFNKLDLIAKPPIREMKTKESESKLVLPDKKTDLKAKLSYKSYGKKNVKFDAKLTLEKGSVAVPTTVTLSYDTASGALVIGPEGVQFLNPVSLDIDVENLDPFADNSTVYLVRVNDDKTFQSELTEELVAQGRSGKIKVKGARIQQAGTLMLGSDIELLTIPAIALVKKYEVASKLVEPGRDAKMDAEFQYISTNGNKVTLTANMKIPAGAVDAPVMITMQFDQLTGRVVFAPEGLQFLLPAELDVDAENINNFLETGIEFVYVSPDGTFEPQMYGSMSVNGDKGKVNMKKAEINHFSQYAFGRRY